MPTYVSLVNWTEQGIKNFPDTIRRAEEFSRFVQGSVARSASCCGPSASTTSSVSPSSPTMRRRLPPFSLGSAGNVRTRTLRAFNSKEMDAIINLTGVRTEHGSWG